MRAVLAGDDRVPFLDEGARTLLEEGRRYYRRAGLDTNQVLERGAEICLLTWHGDWVNDALALVLARYGLRASNEGLVVNIKGSSMGRVLDALNAIAELDNLDLASLLADVKNILLEKWDLVMPEAMARKSFTSLCLDLAGSRNVARTIQCRFDLCMSNAPMRQ